MKKFNIEIEKGGKFKEYEVEFQPAENFIYSKNVGVFQETKDTKEFAKFILSETIVSPSELKDVEFYKDDFEGLNLITTTLMELQAGFISKKGRKAVKVLN